MTNARHRMVLCGVGIVLFFLQLFLPVLPGPGIIGDAIPAFLSLLAALSYIGTYSGRGERPMVNLDGEAFSLLLLFFSILHFLFPALVLI